MSQRWAVEPVWEVLSRTRPSQLRGRGFGTITCRAQEETASVPERTRKLRDNRMPFHLRPWLRNSLILAAGGFVVVQSYQYYEQTRSKHGFVKFKLVKKEPVSSTAAIFELEPADKSTSFDLYKEAWRKGIWNVHFKQPQIQIVRAYTPLPPAYADSEKRQTRLRFLIRHDPHGEVSSYLHNLPEGADIELRGPNLEYHLTPDVRQVLFFAGGTGIAPALQIAHAMFDAKQNKDHDADDDRRRRQLHILWANRKREDCEGGRSDGSVDVVPPKPYWTGFLTEPQPKVEVQLSSEKGRIVQELEELQQKHPGQITVEYFVNEEHTWIGEDEVFKALSRFDDKDFSGGYATPQEQRQILISGPAGFISYLAGPKEWKKGREQQGGVGKILAHAISQNPHNVKVWKI